MHTLLERNISYALSLSILVFLFLRLFSTLGRKQCIHFWNEIYRMLFLSILVFLLAEVRLSV